MLKTISAALVATALIAAPALAANAGSTAGTTTQTQSQPTADTTAPSQKAAKATPSKSKKLHSVKTSHHHGKKISLHKNRGKVASKVSAKPVTTKTRHG